MALPGHRRTSSEGKKRAQTFRLARRSVGVCGHCSATVLQHHACKKCGYYAGRPTLRVKSTKKKK